MGTVIREMEDGEDKKRLLNFRQKNKNGHKYIKHYYLEEVFAPGDLEPRQVLRKCELKWEKAGLSFVGKNSSMLSTSGIILMVTLARRGLGNTATPSIGMSVKFM